MAWAAWLLILVVVLLIFIWLWRFASKIEKAEAEEQQWIEYINALWQSDPQQAWFWEQQFKMKYKIK